MKETSYYNSIWDSPYSIRYIFIVTGTTNALWQYLHAQHNRPQKAT